MFATRNISAAVHARLVERLFATQTVTALGVIGAAIVGSLSYFDSHQPFFVAWAAVSMLLNIAAIGQELAFRRRRDRTASTVTWQRIYLLGAVLNGSLCGIGGASSIFVQDPFVQMLQFGTWATFVMSAAARNALYPAAVTWYLSCAGLPMLAACLSKHDVSHAVYGGLHVMYIACAATIARALYDQTVSYLCVDEENTALVHGIQNANAELAAVNGQLATIAATDALTGIPNRRSFDEALARYERAAQRDPMHFSLLMLDIDFFKKYNDRYGHRAGDECLCRVAACVAKAVGRASDFVARYGGEEFVVILPSADEVGALAIAEHIRLEVAALAIESADSPVGVVTVSVGAAHAEPGKLVQRGQLLDCADAGLYESKRAGRNRVTLRRSPPVSPTAVPSDPAGSAPSGSEANPDRR